MADGAGLALPMFPTAATREMRLSRVWVVVAVGGITALAACLRLLALSRVGGNPFYDAAVRSMGDSLRNFFFGAFEPSGSVSIDKPPVDLWLQVGSVKLFGYNAIALKLPEALGGTLAVPLLFDAVRRVFGIAAGLCAALALAVLPVAVLTSRSDTMDAVMGLLLVGALWCLIRAAQTRHTRWIMFAAVCVGVAFNVKLLEAFVPVPAFAFGAWLACDGSRARRARTLGLALVVLVAVSLSWLTATSIVGSQPFAIGSTNGSPWNAAFVFNGLERVTGAPAPTPAITPISRPAPAAAPPAAAAPAHQTKGVDLDARLAVTPPGVARLLARGGSVPATRIGLELLAALLLGLPALWSRRRESPATLVASATIGAWIVIGAVFFSAMSRLHPRYMEAMTPAVAAGVGIGIAWLGTARGRRPLLGGLIAIVLGAYATWVSPQETVATVGLVVTVIGVACVGWAAFGRATRNANAARIAPWGVALVLCGLLAAPIADAVDIVHNGLSDSGRPGSMPAARVVTLSRFFRANRDGARYEFAVAGATQAGELIVHDNQPVLVLTTFNGRPRITTAALARAAARGDVRYVLLGGGCTNPPNLRVAVCSAPAQWVRHHGIDVSAAAGVYPGLVWMLGPQAERIHAARDAAHQRSHDRRAHLLAIARLHPGPLAVRHRRKLDSERAAARRRRDRHRHHHDQH